MSKISLVLEGGGMRGAYTAGCLSWLLKEGIEFDGTYGISTGAVHLSSYLLKSEDYLYQTSTHFIADKRIIGLKALLHEGRLVSYDLLFSKIMPDEVHFRFEDLKDIKVNAKIGVYDLQEGKTVYYPLQELGADGLKAACSLPIIGKVVNYKGHKLLDGGITDMIPIKQAVLEGNDKHLIITTKPAGYVRKKAPWIVRMLMKLFYLSTPSIGKDYDIRHLNYADQIETIKKLEEEGNALYFYPTKNLKVSRLSGDPETLKELYQLGFDDMESRRAEIYKLLEK